MRERGGVRGEVANNKMKKAWKETETEKREKKSKEKWVREKSLTIKYRMNNEKANNGEREI